MNIPKCVILAAGASIRLRPLTEAMPKCLLKVGRKTLLERTIENVLAVGIKEIAVVVGYQAEMIREFVKRQFPQQRIRLILNPNYTHTNNAYSLLLARRFLEDENGKVDRSLLLLDSDIFFSQRLLPILLEQSCQEFPELKQSESWQCHVAVRVSGEHNEEEIRVKVNCNGNIVLIGKNTPLAETYGESIGIEIFSTRAAAKLFTVLEQRMRNNEGRDEFYEMTFQKMIEEGITLKAVDISPFPAIEIDTLEDLQRAERILLDLSSPNLDFR
ncbi:MAG: phosphocholine cytidylyltransferase family protein [Bacteroidota bacterium]|jgi:choline kinase